ncbi:MAG: cytochrome c nitrite reductase small subunit [Thermoanaerobaculia bacterium]
MRVRTVVLVIGVLVGLAAGIGSYTFVYAKGYSYMTNDPAACANCHVMESYYSGWMKGPHRSVAVCNDCHTPPGLVGKYSTKASNGFWHSFYFTTGNYPDHLEIKPHNLKIADGACLKCHTEITQAILSSPAHREVGKTACIRCHSDVGHM